MHERRRGVKPPKALAGLWVAALLAMPAAAQDAEPSPSALLFGKRCGGCHTLGEGDRAGPDLVGVLKRRDREWVKGFIQNPDSYFDKGDQTALGLLSKFNGVRMPAQALTPEELDGMLAYFEECTTKGGCKLVLGKVKVATEARPDEIQLGRALFEGTAPLANGGPPCISCHNVRDVGVVGGGTLAKDLTHVYARLGDQGLSAALASTPFPLMKNIYAKATLKDDEAFQLKAYLWDASRDGTPPRADNNFLYAGVLGLFLSLGLIGLLWSGRIRAVRQNVVKRGNHR